MDFIFNCNFGYSNKSNYLDDLFHFSYYTYSYIAKIIHFCTLKGIYKTLVYIRLVWFFRNCLSKLNFVIKVI